jgi:light-regulated signal transduction histidine kinase (bacteriophytochrome)
VVERTDRLEVANQELEAFSYSVSHDLRAPLRHIDGFVGLLLERCRADLTDQGRHYVDTIADSARQMGRLIDELLQFSRNGRVELHEAGVDMNRAVREALNTVANEWAGRTIEWVIGDLAPVRGDGAMLRLVWTNLLGNAIKYTRAKTRARIEVTAHEGPDETTFVVRDDGVGFDMRYAHKLFGVFQRLHSDAEFEGTGIGLATVRRIVSRHGGRTWAEGELGAGAAFYFTLPRSRGDGPCPS